MVTFTTALLLRKKTRDMHKKLGSERIALHLNRIKEILHNLREVNFNYYLPDMEKNIRPHATFSSG